jgi:hypothetical protein
MWTFGQALHTTHQGKAMYEAIQHVLIKCVLQPPSTTNVHAYKANIRHCKHKSGSRSYLLTAMIEIATGDPSRSSPTGATSVGHAPKLASAWKHWVSLVNITISSDAAGM